MTEQQKKYQEVCQTQIVPLHAQYWWMQATAIGKRWDVISLQNSQEQMIAMLPVHIWEHLGIRCLVMPPHTQLTWLWLDKAVAGSDVSKVFVEEVVNYIRRNRISLFYIQGYFDEDLLEVFQQHHFRIKERRSYQIPPSKEELFQTFSTNKKRLIKKAIRSGISLSTLSVSDFYAVHTRFISQRGKRIDYSKKFLETLATEALQRGQGRIMTAVDANGEVLAALFLVWDSQVCYYLLPTYNADYANSGAMAWLTMQAILFAQQKNLIFDFEGSMSPTIAHSYSQFGSIPSKYYSVEKSSLLLRVLLSVKTLLQR